MAERVAREVATAMALSDDVFRAVNKAQFAVESLGLPKATDQRNGRCGFGGCSVGCLADM